MPTLVDQYLALTAGLPAQYTGDVLSGFADPELTENACALAEMRRHVDTASAMVAGEIARQSARDLGYDGLAVRTGARTPEQLIQNLTGVSGKEAIALVKVGTMMATLDTSPDVSEATVPSGPVWLRDVAAAVRAGMLSPQAASVIQTALGEPGDTVTVDALTIAARELLDLASTLTLDRLGVRARQFRDDLDSAGVAVREEELRDKRYLSLSPQSDGMTRISGLLDPESAATVRSVFNSVSPRRGGPR